MRRLTSLRYGIALALIPACLLASGELKAEVPACIAAPAIEPVEATDIPNVRVWQGNQLQEGLGLIDCAPWQSLDIDLVGATAAKIEAETTLEAMIQRIGDIPGYNKIRFWSFDRKQWDPLFDTAEALSGPNPEMTREAFPPEAFEVGAELYMLLDESDRVSGMVQRATVLAHDEDRLVIETENVTPGKIWVIEAIAPGGTGGIVSITRNDEGGWDYYAVTRVTYSGSSIFDIPDRAFINRATAFYRYTVGVPTDTEPPAAP